jgi:hypothetical protein
MKTFLKRVAFSILPEKILQAVKKVYYVHELNLSFKEELVRSNGRISISFEFNSLDFRTARFINSIHGYGEVSILNDHVDELDDKSLPRRKPSYAGTRNRFRETSR